MREFTPILTSILSAAASRLNAAEVPAALVHLAPGATVAHDSCCEGGGQLYLRVIEVYPSVGNGSNGVPFPQMDAAQRGVGCGINVLAFHLALGAIRCAHVLDDSGHPPTADEMSHDAEGTMVDLALLLDTLACDLAGLPGVMQTKIGRWTPQGPQGGCAGGEWDFYVGLDPCLCV